MKTKLFNARICALFAAVGLNACGAHTQDAGQFVWGGAFLSPIAGDFDGDGRADAAAYDPSGGLWYLMSLTQGVIAWAKPWGGPGLIPCCADFDGDGADEIAVYAPESGAWYAQSLSSGVLVWGETWGGPGFLPVCGDYDGDGTDDLAVYDRDNGMWYIASLTSVQSSVSSPQNPRSPNTDNRKPNASSPAHASLNTVHCTLNADSPRVIAWAVPWGFPGAIPAPADYDGDGAADLAVYDSMSGAWYVRSTAGSILTWGRNWGGAGLTPVPGDYDGDGLADFAVCHSNGAWYILSSTETQMVFGAAWGWAETRQLCADFDGDGADDLAAYHPGSGAWYWRKTPWQTADDIVTGRVFHVATNGDDGNPGTQTQPWATPGYGSRQLQPGDTLVIMGGTYLISRYDEDIIVPASGRADAWITVRGETGNRPILSGTDNLACAVNVGGRQYVLIENLEMTSLIDSPYSGGLRTGVDAGGSAAGAADVSNLTLDGLYIHHTENCGINFSGDMFDVQLLNTRVSHTCMTAVGAPASYGRGGWRNVVISNCYLGYAGHFYDGQEHSVTSLYDRPDGLGMEPSDGPLEVAHTIAEHNFGDGLDSKCRNTFIHHCVVANNSCDMIKLWGAGSRVENTLIYGRGDGSAQPTPWAGIVIGTTHTNGEFAIVNVTLDDGMIPFKAYPIYAQYDDNIPISLTMRNTIVRGTGAVWLNACVDLTADHNLFHMPGCDTVIEHGAKHYDTNTIALLGAGNISGDPMFVSPAWGTNGDYRVLSASPARDAGTTNGAPSTDLEGNSRPAGAGVDMGAYEQ